MGINGMGKTHGMGKKRKKSDVVESYLFLINDLDNGLAHMIPFDHFYS